MLSDGQHPLGGSDLGAKRDAAELVGFVGALDHGCAHPLDHTMASIRSGDTPAVSAACRTKGPAREIAFAVPGMVSSAPGFGLGGSPSM